MEKYDAMTADEKTLFHARTAECYQDQRRRADGYGFGLRYDVFDLQALVRAGLGSAACPYCRGPVTVREFCLEYRTPVVRGGKFTLANLVVCCPDCRRAKGLLDDAEFRTITRLAEAWPRPVRRDFLARLRIGAPVRTDVPEPGSLNWFTDAPEPHDVLVGTSKYRKLYRDQRGVLRHEVLDDAPAVGEPADGGTYAI